MRHRIEVRSLSLLTGRAQLFDRELRAVDRVGGAGDAAAGPDLDLVGAVAHCSRTARRTSPTPSAMAPISPRPAQLQNIACERTPLGRMSAWPPVCEMGK